MRTIQKIISLEPLTSRLPGVLPAYKDNVLYYFDDESLRSREYEFTSNYGMVPVNIMLDNAPSAATDWNFSYDSHCYGQTLGVNKECYEAPFYDEFPKFTLSWEELSDWYKFFTDYYHLLNDWGHCGVVYSSATHYYLAESKNGYADQLVYGGDEETYREMDDLFEARGGSVEIRLCDEEKSRCNFDKCNEHDVIHESVDKGFYKWICENIIPTFVIPAEYKDYWKRDVLYYPDVIKWIGWLKDRSGYGSYDTKFECSGSTDCCECEEWFNRGGNDILEKMEIWYDSVQNKILKNIDSVQCAIPTIIMPVNMQISIDDLGEFSIFSKEYELGIDYRTIKTKDDGDHTTTDYDKNNSNGGTVVTIDGKTMILTAGTGFEFDNVYMEMYRGDGWAEYNPDLEQVACSFEEYDYAYREPNSGYTTDGYPIVYEQGELFYYTFDKYNRRITSSGETDLRQELAVLYPIEEYDSILIGNSLYEVERAEYGSYSGNNRFLDGKIFYVFREQYTDTPYTLINGKKIYADFYSPGLVYNVEKQKCEENVCNQFYYFPFFNREETDIVNDSTCSASTFNPCRYKQFPRTSTQVTDYEYYITYAGSQHKVTASGVTINENEFPRVSKICNTDDETLYILYGDDDVVDIWHFEGDVLTITSGYTITSGGTEIQKIIDDNVKVYTGGVLTGNTISKLNDLRSNALLVDDIGNTIEALYNVGDKYNHQPPEGTELEPIYQVGNTANVHRFSMTVERPEDLSGDTNYFIGDIITEMVFYYKTSEGEVDYYTMVVADTPTSGETTSLKAITESTEKMLENSIEASGDTLYEEDIYCDITYYIGATLQRTADDESGTIGSGNFTLAEDATFSHGVQYKETVKFVKTEVQYYLKPEYKRQIPMTRNTPSAHTVSYPVTCYVMQQEQNRIESDYGNAYYCGLAYFEMPLKTDTVDFELYNGTQVLPIFREEYNIGMACMQNVDSDIYIDRGINTAFERHLKLGEVTSMEALEQYTNGYFKIMDN